MNAQENISKATVQLLLKQPFFACLAMRMKYIPGKEKTCVTDGKSIEYNTDYFEKLSIDELNGVIAHEVLHTAMLHHTRRNNRDLEMWNKAADYAINPILIDSGFTLPADCLINPAYSDKTAEQIYALMQAEEQENGGKQQNGQDSAGGTGDVKEPPSQTNIPEAEAEMLQAVSNAARLAKGEGKLPESLNRFIKELLEPKISWKEVLARFLSEITKNDYTWIRPSTRYLHLNLYLPLLESLTIGKIIIIADTSGSIDDEIINQFAGETQEIATTFHTDLQVMYVDSIFQSIQDIDPNEPIKLEPKGGGGTDFRPGFEYIEQNDLQPKAVVYLTDGICRHYPDEPDYPVLWAIFGDYPFSPPFGEVIHIH